MRFLLIASRSKGAAMIDLLKSAEAPSPAEFAEAWGRVLANAIDLARATALRAADTQTPLPYDPTAPARAFADYFAQLGRDPGALFRAQQQAVSDWMQLWTNAAARFSGREVEPLVEPERGDRRFKDPAWSEQPAFDYLKQAYLLAAKRTQELIANTEGLDERTRTRVDF